MVTVANDITRCNGTKSFTIQLTPTRSNNTESNSIALQGGNINITGKTITMNKHEAVCIDW